MSLASPVKCSELLNNHSSFAPNRPIEFIALRAVGLLLGRGRKEKIYVNVDVPCR